MTPPSDTRVRTPRDPHKPADYFDWALAENVDEQASLASVVAASGLAPTPRLRRMEADLSARAALLTYSRGDALEVVARHAQDALLLMEQAYVDPTGFDEAKVVLDVYEEALHLVCFARLFDMDRAVLARFTSAWRRYNGDDALLTMLAGESPATPKLLHPKVYGPALAVCTAPEGDRAKLLRDYMTNWFSSMRRALWRRHLAVSKTGGVSLYRGYWCIEAATLAAAFGIDDTACRALPYYPAALVDDYRSRHGLVVAAATPPPPAKSVRTKTLRHPAFRLPGARAEAMAALTEQLATLDAALAPLRELCLSVARAGPLDYTLASLTPLELLLAHLRPTMGADDALLADAALYLGEVLRRVYEGAWEVSDTSPRAPVVALRRPRPREVVPLDVVREFVRDPLPGRLTTATCE